MAQGTYTDFPTVATQDTWTAAQHNTYLRDNLGYLLSMAEPTLTNKSGSTRTSGELVKVDTSNDSSFTTTTTASDTGTFGVVASASIANNSTGRVAVGGVVTIQTTGTVTRGDYLESSTTAGKAKSAGVSKTGSTFAIALTTASAGTCTALILPSVSVALPISARVYNNASQAMTYNTWNTLSFNSEDWDNDGMHSTVSNTSRITIATPGKYLFIAALAQDSAGASFGMACRLYKNGTTDIGQCGDNSATAGTASKLTDTFTFMPVSLAAGDYVELQNWGTKSGGNNCTYTADKYFYLSVMKVG